MITQREIEIVDIVIKDGKVLKNRYNNTILIIKEETK